MSNRYKGGVISATPPTTSGPYENGAASGVWTLEQQMQVIASGTWPLAGNVPSYIEDVFSTYLYTGNDYNQTIYNNIQLASGVNLIPGQALGGGYFGGFISTTADGVATHALIVGPVASAQSSTTIQYKNANTATAGADSDIDGPQNTADMVADGNATVYPAAHFCNDLVIGGFSDWYMPAKNELEVCYYTLKPTTAANDTSAGINPNAVPARASNYQPSGPAQTAAANFQNTGAEDFGENWYWSSTESSATQARLQYFGDGLQAVANKNTSYQLVRAIRRIAINDAALDPYRVTGKGGMVWMKSRSNAFFHGVYDTVRGTGTSKSLYTNTNEAQGYNSTNQNLTAFNANGFTLGTTSSTNALNGNGGSMCSWTFREQPKFFDIVTWTGTGSNTTIAHNLGSVPGCIIVKRLDAAANWAVYHRSLANTQYLILNLTNAAATGATWWNSTTPTSAVFSLGTDASVNASGGTYVAYVFAHDAGGFGLTGTDNVISCGSFVSDGSGGCSVTLGYEPQIVIYKNITNTEVWRMADVMRGWNQTQLRILNPNSTAVEGNVDNNPSYLAPTSTGFNTPTPGYFTPSNTFVYIAIRRGPMKVPTLGTSVFSPVTSTSSGLITAGFPVDLVINRATSASTPIFVDRLRSVGMNTRMLFASATNAEDPTGGGYGLTLDNNVGANNSGFWGSGTPVIYECFKRAPSFFDVVICTQTGSAQNVTHNLGVAPELLILKDRTTAVSWQVGTQFTSTTWNNLILNTTDAGTVGAYNNYITAQPTSSVFGLGPNLGSVNDSFVAYLFATCAGVSKVGTYTGNAGNTVVVPCGFTSGVRFVLIKRTDSTGDWYFWDSARGIIAGNDPYLLLNSTSAEVTGTDYVDTYSAGFEVTSTAPAALNATGGTYIFLAIA